MSSLILGVLSALGYGTSNALGRKLAQIDPSVGLVLRGAPLILMLVLLVPFFDIPHVTFNGVLISLLVGILGYLPIFFLYKGFAVSDVGTVLPLAYINPSITTLLAIGISGAQFTASSLMGIFLLIVGAVVISYNKNFTFNLGILYGLLAGLGWGIVFFLFQYPVALVGPLLASLFVEVGVAVIACLHILYDRKNIRVDTIVSEAPPLFILFLSFCAMVGSLCFMLSAEAIGVAYTSALGALSPIVGGLVGILYFKESITLQKVMALLCTAVGISLIALS